MTVYKVKDAAGEVHTVTADRYVPEAGPGGDATVISYHFCVGQGLKVASFVSPLAITTYPDAGPLLSPRVRASFLVNGEPGDVARLLRRWADEHNYHVTDLTTSRL